MSGDGSVLGDIGASGWDLGAALLLGLLVAALVRGARFAIDVAPALAPRREALTRAFPLVAAAIGVLYLLFAAGLVFERYPQHFPIAVAVILGVTIAASWFAVKDLVSGIVLRAGRVLRVGDRVRAGALEGRVLRMGHRVLVVETARGEEAIVPYSALAREAVVRAPLGARVVPHTFTLVTARDLSVPETKATIREAALVCHWAALGRDPEVVPLDGDRFEVTIYALDADRVRDVERAVRSAVETPRSGADDQGLSTSA